MRPHFPKYGNKINVTAKKVHSISRRHLQAEQGTIKKKPFVQFTSGLKLVFAE